MADQSGRQVSLRGSVQRGVRDSGDPVDLAAIRAATLHRQPWTHAVITDTFTDGTVLNSLLRTYPNKGFKRLRQDSGDKRFDIEARNDIQLRDLPDPCPWQAFVHQINSPAYRDAVEELTGVHLRGAVLKTAFYRYGPTCWFGPHRDDERKLVSHIFYANPRWPDGAGGHLLINRSEDMDDIHARVAPVAGTSVIVVRSDSSWHSVEPVSPSLGNSRKSFIAHFYKPGTVVDFYDR